MSDATEPTDRSLRHWLAQWKPIYVIGIDEDDTEHRLAVSKNAKRWDMMVKSLRDLDCARARAYDSNDNVLSTKTLRVVPSEGVAPMGPATSGGVDVAAIILHTTTALTSSFERILEAVAVKVVGEVTKAHATSFAEMVNITKVATSRLTELERTMHEDLMARREELDAEKEEAAAEKENSRALDALMAPLVAAAGPELVKKGVEFLATQGAKAAAHASNGAAAVDAGKTKG